MTLKRIPVAAGLAGGSSDAAAVFVGLNKLFGLKIPKRINEFRIQIRCRYSVLYIKGTALAEGIGESLQIAPNAFCYVVIAKPNFSVSTAHVYQNLSLDNLSYHPDIEAVIKELKREI